MTFKSIGSLLSGNAIHAKIAARMGQDERNRLHGVQTYGWDASCACVDCGDNQDSSW